MKFGFSVVLNPGGLSFLFQLGTFASTVEIVNVNYVLSIFTLTTHSEKKKMTSSSVQS